LADSAQRMVRARQLVSDTKRSQVLAQAKGFAARGEPFSIAGLARRAGVSERFIHNHPELKAEAARCAAEIGDQLTGRLERSAAVTSASLRADLANARAEVGRHRQEITRLQRRLSEAIGATYLDGLPDGDRIAVKAGQQCAEWVDELEQTVEELRETVAVLTEELDAARELNRDYLARLNKETR
jgi:predicted  nucleic acid-binding Zn-ribbon protein